MTSTAQSIGSPTAAPSHVELESQFGDRGRRRRPRFFLVHPNPRRDQPEQRDMRTLLIALTFVHGSSLPRGNVPRTHRTLSYLPWRERPVGQCRGPFARRRASALRPDPALSIPGGTASG